MKSEKIQGICGELITFSTFFRRSLIYKIVSYFFILRFCLGEIKKLVQKAQKRRVLRFKNIHLSKFLDPELMRKKGDTIL